MKHFIEKRVRRKLNCSRRSREQSKFDSLKNVFLCAELLIFGSALRFFFSSDISYLPFCVLQIPAFLSISSADLS